MDEEIKNELNKILNELPTENSWLDYKAKAYEKSELASLTNDLCAFLNSEQSFGRNKYIICGIGDNKDRLEIKEKDMLDDHYFQDVAKKIYPTPKIETGTFKHVYRGKEYCYGYILISKDNDDRVYEIENGKIKRDDNNLYTIKQICEQNVFAPVAWIRIGSTKDILKEPTRRRIYEFDNLKKKFTVNDNIGYLLDDNRAKNDKIIKTALLFGEWNENNINDKKIIEKFSEFSYNEFIEIIRQLAKNEKNFYFKNGVWKIKNRIKYIEFYSLNFYKEDLESFKKIIVEILSEKHPKFDLSSDKRYLYNIYNKVIKYSAEIRNGVAETLVFVEYLKSNFENCKDAAANFSVLTIRNILESSNWYTWASLDNLLPLFAEASPSEYLQQLKKYLFNDKEKKILIEKEEGITTYNYSTSIYSSLELIAWNKEYCVSACMILFEFAKEDKKAINHIVNIILPWHPNTFAPLSYRLVIVENIIKRDILIGWQILKKLMPEEVTYAIPTYKPKYINVPKDDISVTNEEYFNQIDLYLDIMIKNCKTSNDRLLDLINLLNKVSKKNFYKICNYLKSSKVCKKNDSSKYKLWDNLEITVSWIKKHSQINAEAKKEMLEKINEVINCLKPQNNLYVISRLFKNDEWKLFDEYDNYDEAEKKLSKLQFDCILNIYKENGIKKIIELAKIVEDTFLLGIITSKIKISYEDEKNIVVSNLDKRKKLIEYAKGYVYNKYNLQKNKYDSEMINNLSNKSKLNFLLMLPYTILTFKNVERFLGKDYKKYWKQVDIRIINEEEALNYSIIKLMEVKRYERVLWMYRLSLQSNKQIKCDNNIILTCLEKIKSNFNKYDICEAIKDLQENNANEERLFNIEWKFLPLLNDKKYRPITIEKVISTNANKYSEILELAFKEKSKINTESNINPDVATNAYRLLHQWKLVPGTNDDGYINSVKLKEWYEEMQNICNKKDRLEVGLLYFGKVLFYSPEDKSHFWIDKTVAEILNNNETIRRGYTNEAFNSIGIIKWDEKGSEYLKYCNEYKKKAEDTEIAGYYNFAMALRDVADNFNRQAEYVKDRYHDF
ncbi:MAG TPA: putative DNA binding domain-containing protein [Candidatus Coprosoma intestinipullorum]|uniref:DNA binding domain-containing protein n=1 Tax=Candidatus Coprosoma intestinipullorum TaxID=2840752 RepID=A0A9D0ZQ47_9FIRM|nr:putative DNA binding domain-containing protein [Candidatus Coprosoma intestinipullorum]